MEQWMWKVKKPDERTANNDAVWCWWIKRRREEEWMKKIYVIKTVSNETKLVRQASDESFCNLPVICVIYDSCASSPSESSPRVGCQFFLSEKLCAYSWVSMINHRRAVLDRITTRISILPSAGDVGDGEVIKHVNQVEMFVNTEPVSSPSGRFQCW